jgi:WS/DGAT/MGAT family acyltransferase
LVIACQDDHPSIAEKGAQLRSPIDRVSANDMVTLATDRGPAPMNIGAILIVDAAADLDFATVTSTLASRLPRVRRLRQRLVRTPPGGGRPIWVDSPDFDLDRHLSLIDLSVPVASTAGSAAVAGEDVLRIAADLVCTPLARDEPLWAARWLTGLSDDRAALVLVMHHALTDGVGGLAVLDALGDGGPDPVTDSFPEPPPQLRSVFADVWRDRIAALIQLPGRLRAGRQGLRELGFRAGRPTLAPRTSLNRPTGPRRRLTTVQVPLGPLLESAHRRGSKLNDLILTAVTGAMTGVLRVRGEQPGQLVVSVPISARRTATANHLGNQTGVAPLTIPTLTDQAERLRRITAMSSARRSATRGTSAGPMGLVFRVLGALRIFQFFIDHQRLVHTFVTNVHGPDSVVHFAGHPIGTVIPVAITPGNVGVCVDVLSYAGGLVITVVADPDIVPDQDLLTSLLAKELDQLVGGAGS